MEDFGENNGSGVILVSDVLREGLLCIAKENVRWNEIDAFVGIAIQIFDICDMLDMAEMIAEKYPKQENTRSVLDVLLEALTKHSSLSDVTDLYTRLMEL